jgi:hypothetical protein
MKDSLLFNFLNNLNNFHHKTHIFYLSHLQNNYLKDITQYNYYLKNKKEIRINYNFFRTLQNIYSTKSGILSKY